VYDADSRAKNLMTTDGILIRDIQKEFGTLSYHSDGTLNRKHLGERAFGDAESLAKLNALVHPRVGVDYEKWVAGQMSMPYVIKEAALLFEAGSYRTLDKLVVVTAPEEVRINRVLLRDPHRTEQMVQDIIRNQMPEEEKLKRANFIIYNDESRLVIPQVLELHKRFISREL
jgi:dephospho-CoA kinase